MKECVSFMQIKLLNAQDDSSDDYFSMYSGIVDHIVLIMMIIAAYTPALTHSLGSVNHLSSHASYVLCILVFLLKCYTWQ